VNEFSEVAQRLDDTLDALGLGNARLAVASSGGADSAALAYALVERAKRRGEPLPSLLHVNHHWSEYSALLQAGAQRLATTLGVLLRVMDLDLDPATATERLGREGTARRARYEALAELAEAGEIIALAHHADDRVETQLLKLAQGVGLSGLAGPRELFDAHGTRFVRPLLTVSRSDLRALTAFKELPFKDDPSNHDHTLLRNVVRDLVVPPLTTLHGPAALRRSGAVLASEARAFSGALDALLDTHCQDVAQRAPAIALPVAALAALPVETRSALIRRGWHRVGVRRPDRAFVERTRELICATPGADATGPGSRAERWWHHLVLSPTDDPRAALEISDQPARFEGGCATAGGYCATMAYRDASAETATSEVYAFDEAGIRGDVFLRLASVRELMTAFGRGRAERVTTLHGGKAKPAWRNLHTWVIADRAGPLLVCGGKRSDRAPMTGETRRVVTFHVDYA
jgi:tRNA(Ile)-lysidine synthetase-like protein